MKTVEIKCDACDADLSDAGAMPTYRLSLTPERVPHSGGIIYGVAVRPDIDREHHFCGLSCLDKWRADAINKIAWRERWRKEHQRYLGHGAYVIDDEMPDDAALAEMYGANA